MPNKTISTPGWYILSVSKEQEETPNFNAIDLVNSLLDNPAHKASLYPTVFYRESPVPPKPEEPDNVINDLANIRAETDELGNTFLRMTDDHCNDGSVDWDTQSIFCPLIC